MFDGFLLGSPAAPENRAVAGTGVPWKWAARESVFATPVAVNVPA
jgi:hypothetical protein